MIATRSVRAAIAAASIIGDGRWPSSVAWCSDRMTATAPRVSAQAHMSNAAPYRSGVGAPVRGDTHVEAQGQQRRTPLAGWALNTVECTREGERARFLPFHFSRAANLDTLH